MSKSRNARPFLFDMTKMDLVDIEASAYVIPFCFHCYVCSSSLALGALVHASSLSHDLCHGTHGTDVPRAKTSELKLLTAKPQFTLIHAYPSFPADDLDYTSIHLLNFYDFFGKDQTSEPSPGMIPLAFAVR